MKKNAYEHYVYNKNGNSYFKGYYTPDLSKGPVGNYSIIHNGKEGELAVRDIVKETNYTDVSREDVTRTITLEYSSRDIQKSEVFVREKGSRDERKLLNTQRAKRSMYDHMSGVSSEINIYSETRRYGEPNMNKNPESSSSANIEVIKNIVDIVLDIVPIGKKR